MMLRRALLMFALILGSHSNFAAESASDNNTDAAATGSADAAASTESDTIAADSDAGTDSADADGDAAAGSLDGEGFVPSVQISEDLSVSFPTDI
jgi:hypothetical protein